MWHDRFSSALNGDTFWPLNRTFNAQKMVKETSLGAKGRLFQILNTVINQKTQKKKFRVISSQNDIQFSIYSRTPWTTAPSQTAVASEACCQCWSFTHGRHCVYNRVTQRRGPPLQSLAYALFVGYQPRLTTLKMQHNYYKIGTKVYHMKLKNTSELHVTSHVVRYS